jgi:flagellar motor switch/type III secretory pathway protein FliN
MKPFETNIPFYSFEGPDDKEEPLFDESFFEDDEEENEEEQEDNLEQEFNEESEDEFDQDSQEPSVPVSPPPSAKAFEAPPRPSANTGSMDNVITQKATPKNLPKDIQFRLVCELGQVLIPFENLQELDIGSVVNFNNTLQNLYLSVNNVRVGEGMLVNIDGKIGIKVTNWYGHL